MKTRTIVCGVCRESHPHVLTVGNNLEIVATCDNCGQFVKIPGGISLEEANDYLEKTNEANSKKVVLAEELVQEENPLLDALAEE